MGKAERYPLDFDALKRGQYIPPERIAEISGEPAGTKAHRLCALKLKGQITKALTTREGFEVMTKMEGDGIRILNAIEQNDYAPVRWDGARRALTKAFRQDIGNDASALSGEAQKRRQARLAARGWYQGQLNRRPPRGLLEGKKGDGNGA